MDGESENEGRLEICFRNHWGTICDDEFDAEDAALACMLLGYPAEGMDSFNVHTLVRSTQFTPKWTHF